MDKRLEFGLALTTFYRSLMDSIGPAEERPSPIYTGEVARSAPLHTDTAMSPSQISQSSKVNLTHTPSSKFDISHASSPDVKPFEKTSYASYSQLTDREALEESNIYVPQLDSSRRRRNVFEDTSPPLKPETPCYNKPKFQVRGSL